MLRNLRERWIGVQSAALDQQTVANDAGGILSAASRVLRLMVQSGILGLGAYLAIQHEITGGAMIAASIIMSRALAPVEQAVGSWQQFISYRKARERLSAILSSIPAEAPPMALPPPRGKLDVENLIIQLPGVEKPLLHGISFSLQPGEGLGVIGPTGAGKSTLTNSLVGASVSQSGILRPTTREPVLIYNPADGPALHTLGLVREKDEAPTADASRWVRLRAVPNADLVPGLAVIDSPDLDSRVESNRELAGQLLAVADLWMFVTTGTDYADALSWDLLGVASRRKVAVAVVLNRLRQRESTTVRNHFATLLTGAGLAHAHVFTLPEVTLVEERIPVQFILSMQRWLERQARRGRERDEHLARTFDGTIDQAVTAALSLADAAADQVVAARRLRVVLAFSIVSPFLWIPGLCPSPSANAGSR
jgi:energy-coupling factor transporter ATP-binding protein EcfA2